MRGRCEFTGGVELVVVCMTVKIDVKFTEDIVKGQKGNGEEQGP